MKLTQLPFVSVLLVTRNEKDYVERALLSLINQTYPKDRYEIIVADGMSNDGTIDIINKLQGKYLKDGLEITIVTNTKKLLAAGWNIAIKLAKGEYVTRIDAHAEAAPDFVWNSVNAMLKVDAVCVGGKLTSLSLDGEENVISKVLSSPFGVGNSSFRVSTEACYTDTAVYGLYKKSIFEEVGLFDETMVRNQDIEFHSRIKAVGYRFYFDPSIRCTYYTRNTLSKMLKQAYGNGFWNMKLLKKGCSALSLRHLVPFAFIIFLIVSIIGGYLYWPIWLIGLSVICLHLCLGVYFATKKTHNIKEIIEMPWLFISLHIIYGFGYIMAIFK